MKNPNFNYLFFTSSNMPTNAKKKNKKTHIQIIYKNFSY